MRKAPATFERQYGTRDRQFYAKASAEVIIPALIEAREASTRQPFSDAPDHEVIRVALAVDNPANSLARQELAFRHETLSDTDGAPE